MLSTLFKNHVRQQYIVVIICLLSILFVGVTLYNKDKNNFNYSIKEANLEANKFLKLFSEYVELHISTVDMLLKQSEDYLRYLGMPQNNSQHTDELFHQWLHKISYVTSIFYANDQGKITFMSQENNQPRWFHRNSPITHRNFFMSHYSDNKNILKIHSPGTPEIIVDDLFIISRRINNLDGSFNGIIGATIQTSFLEDLFNALGKNTKITLIVENKKIFTFGHNNNSDINAFSMILQHVRSNYKNNVDSIVDIYNQNNNKEMTQVFAYRNFNTIPLSLLLVLSEKDILEDWHNDHKFHITFFILYSIFAISIAIYTIAMGNHMNKSANSEKTAIMANQAKSDFLAKMSHELRTPLNAIIGFSEMLEAGYFGELNEKQQERTKDINMCGNHLLELINDILEFSKGEAGKLTLLEEIVSPSQIIQEAIRIASQRAKLDDIEIIVNSAKDLPFLKADKRKLKQILINLLTNAVKFSEVKGKVYIGGFVNKNNQFVFVVRDNGIGIAKEDIPKALSVFGQVHKKMESSGTGLGLPLCRIFAELHGGGLRLDSIEGKGTRVAIKLPSNRIERKTINNYDYKNTQEIGGLHIKDIA